MLRVHFRSYGMSFCKWNETKRRQGTILCFLNSPRCYQQWFADKCGIFLPCLRSRVSTWDIQSNDHHLPPWTAGNRSGCFSCRDRFLFPASVKMCIPRWYLFRYNHSRGTGSFHLPGYAGQSGSLLLARDDRQGFLFHQSDIYHAPVLHLFPRFQSQQTNKKQSYGKIWFIGQNERRVDWHCSWKRRKRKATEWRIK